MPAKTTAPGTFFTRLQKKGGRVGDFCEPRTTHLEYADFIGRAETVFDRLQNPEAVAPVTLKIDNCVNHMLQNTRAGDLALFGDTSDQHQRGVG